MANLNLFIEADTGTMIGNFYSEGQAILPTFFFGDEVDVNVVALARNDGQDVGSRPWIMLPEATIDYRLAIGGSSRSPQTGVYKVLTSDEIAFDADATSMQTALNNDATISGEGGVTVVELNGVYQITYNTTGTKTELSVTFNNMLPTSDVFITTTREGDGSTTKVVQLRVEVAASSYAEIDTPIEKPTVSITPIRDGVLNSEGEVQRVFTEVQAYGGSYTLLIDGVAAGEIAYDADATDIAIALAVHPLIGGDEDLITINGDAADFTVTFDSSLGNISTITVDDFNLTGLIGRSGTLSMNTTEIAQILGGSTSIPARLEIVQFNTNTSQARTLTQANITLAQDIIPSSPPSITPIPEYADKNHTHPISDVIDLQTELDSINQKNDEQDIAIERARTDELLYELDDVDALQPRKRLIMDLPVPNQLLDGNLVLRARTTNRGVPPGNPDSFHEVIFAVGTAAFATSTMEVYESSGGESMMMVELLGGNTSTNIQLGITINGSVDRRPNFEIAFLYGSFSMNAHLRANNFTYTLVDAPADYQAGIGVTIPLDNFVKQVELEGGDQTINGEWVFTNSSYTAPNLDPAGDPDSLVTLKDNTDLDWETVTVDGTTTCSLEIIDLDVANVDILRTLPPVALSAGKRYKYIIRNTADLHHATIKADTGETILGHIDGNRVLSLNGDHIEFFSDGVDWTILIDERLAIGAMSRINNIYNQVLSGTAAKISPFTTIDFSSIGRVEADTVNHRLNITEGGAIEHGYEIFFDAGVSASVNNVVQVWLYKNGVNTFIGGGVDLAGSGGGTQAAHASFSGFVSGIAGDYFEVYAVNAGGSTDFNNVRFTAKALTK